MFFPVYYFSAYCGGMWLGALKAYVEMSKLLGEADEAQEFGDILDKAKQNFEKKLWNGKFSEKVELR